MSFLFAILVFAILVVVYILFSPMTLLINTKTNQYYVQILGLVRANLEWHKDTLLQIKIKTVFKTFYIYPLDKMFSAIKKENPKKIKAKSRKRIGIHKGLKLLNTFKVKRFKLDIDTGDCIKNAKLYPIFSFLNYRAGGFNINFQGRNELVLQVQNRPIQILKIFINT